MEDVVADLGLEHGRHGREPKPAEQQRVTAAHLQDLESIALGRIRRAAAAGTLVMTPGLHSVLYRWKAWGSTEEVAQWLHGALGDDETYLTLLDRLPGQPTSAGDRDRVASRRLKIDPEPVRPFVDPGPFVDRAREMLARGDLDDHRRALLQQFYDRGTGRLQDSED